VRSWRVLVGEVLIDGVPVESTYADVFLVVRDDGEGVGPNDWEATVRTTDRLHLRPGRHDLRAVTPEGHEVVGPALLRFSDGLQHHLRGDGPLDGAAAVVA
jgi:hypothetical protein